MSSVGDEGVKRVLTYVRMVEKALNSAKQTFSGGDTEKYILSLAEQYYEDSKYYLSRGDILTALSCISYAEGLIDSLRMLKVVNFTWARERPKRVLVGGTFDLIHPGHIHFLKEASKYGLVYAVVTTDRNVAKFKGRPPILPQEARVNILNSVKYVYKAFVGDETDFVKPVEMVKPDLVVLGPDQPFSEEKLIREYERRGLSGIEVVRLRDRVKLEVDSTTKIINRVKELFCR